MSTIKATEQTKVSAGSNERVDNREDRLDRTIGFFFPATEAEKAFVGKKAEALGTLKFRRAQFENNDRRGVVQNPDSYNYVLLYQHEGKAGLMPLNVARDDDDKIHISHKTEEQFASEPRGNKSHHDYTVTAAGLILSRVLGVDELPDGEELKKLIDSKMEETQSGAKVIPVKRRHHMRSSAQEQRRKDRIEAAKSGGQFTL